MNQDVATPCTLEQHLLICGLGQTGIGPGQGATSKGLGNTHWREGEVRVDS